MAAVVRLLGEVGAEVDGRLVELGTPRQRCVLAALAIDAGRVVPADRLVERVWGVDAAPRARSTLHNYISRLRGVLAGAAGVAIVRRSGGYALIADTAEPVVDLYRFRALCSAAEAAVDDELTARLLTEALALWRGDALTGVAGEWVAAERDRLEQERLATEHELVDARLRAGDGGELLAELSARAVRHPLDERVAGQYLVALHRAGRTTDALEHYRHVRTQLVDELGTDPGAALQELHRQILAADPSLAAAPTRTTRTAAAPQPVVPRQLPAALASFVGREDALQELDDHLNATATTGPVGIVSIVGTGGMGKTSLALHWAHQHTGRFPDGHLWVDLRGFSPDHPRQAGDVLADFLAALGVDRDRLPRDIDARAALYRTHTTGKRMLILLDNAATADQVVPLLPGGDACAVLITSRNRLPALLTRHGARPIPVDVLTDAEARSLLATALADVQTPVTVQRAVTELITLCGGLPLALGLITARIRTHPHLLDDIVVDLREFGLDALSSDDPDGCLTVVLSWSLRHLGERHRAAFALLAIAPGPDTGLPAAINLTGLSARETHSVLRALTDASLITQAPGGRYAMHDLVRAYAATTAYRDLTEQARQAALGRVLDFYTHTAYQADLLLDVHRGPLGLAPPSPGTHVHSPADATEAMAWFDSERATLLAAQHVAALQHSHHTVWWLAMSLDTFHHRRGHRHDRLVAWRAATHATEHLTDQVPRLVAHRHLGRACAALGLHEEAIGHLHHVLDPTEGQGALYEQAHALLTLARVWGRHDDHKALDYAKQALHLFRDLDRPLCEAHGRNAVGWYTARLGDYDTARSHFRTALTLHRQHHNPTGEANTLDSLGYVEHNTGDHHEAVHYYRQALALRRSLGNAYDAASTLEHLGSPHAALGQHDHARVAWREALAMYRQQGRESDAEGVLRQLDALVHAETPTSAGTS
ncbi:DNA-binding SARP family transcriptional activator [Saccharothrix carnea]|uniref:DNA-binding SARP family transcriptional activator n=1 Tax=Saccharothrix carnea TaxID=1280637 RepID=A0A2P8IF66_SACCR|nr:BTAD domain-containing putative transcriptional regulator [Saccharothrix carnea]PSL57093.1 DNA-binding SARP family transcriptional activator [Saccharothrix carnea]